MRICKRKCIDNTRANNLITGENIYSVLLALSCPKALYHLRSDNIFRITVVVADWLDWNPYHRSSFFFNCSRLDYFKIEIYLLLKLHVCIVGMT